MTELVAPELIDVRTMYRAVLSGAVHDLGYGTIVESNEVQSWMRRNEFEVCCELAEWEPAWIRDLLNSIIALDGPVRKPIVKDCLKIMRGVVRISGRSEVTPVSLGGSMSSVGGEHDMKYIGGPVSKLGRASTASHRRRSKEIGDSE